MISFGVRTSPPNLAQVISDLPRSVRGAATEAAARYLVGNGSHGLTHYPAYSYVTRRRAYGSSFFSDRQRRKVMAMIRSGEILPGYPRRTGAFQRVIQIVNDGVKTRILLTAPHSVHLVDDERQARQPMAAGWRRVGLVIASNERGAIQAADRAAQEIIKTLGL
jgi:hypothetical protein